RLVGDPVVIEQAEVAIHPRSAPPFPPEAVTLACPRQVVPYLLLYPVADVREAATRVAKCKVLHPAAQDGIDTRHHLCDGPGPMTSEDLLERLQQRRSLLASRRPQRHPSASPTPNPPELNAYKSEVLALREVHSPPLPLVPPALQYRQPPPQSLFHRRTQPALPRMGVH